MSNFEHQVIRRDDGFYLGDKKLEDGMVLKVRFMSADEIQEVKGEFYVGRNGEARLHAHANMNSSYLPIEGLFAQVL